MASLRSTSSLTTSSSARQRLRQLRSTDLLSLLLSPDLNESLTPGALVGIDNEALFSLLPLILASIHRLGELPTCRNQFVELISVLRMRIAACRALKLRFLLLIRNAYFSQRWEVRLVHRRDCYSSARLLLSEMNRDLKSLVKTGQSLDLAKRLTNSYSSVSYGSEESWTEDREAIVDFALKKLLHKDYGIRTRNLMWRMKVVKNAFYAVELVDGIMERTHLQTRKEAVALAQRVLDLGLIDKVGSNSRTFSDQMKRVYESSVATMNDDAGYCRVKTTDGEELGNWELVKCQGFAKITQIEIQLAMDMIDLQSYHFWTDSVYVKGVEYGFRYGYRAITHPLHCTGSETLTDTEHISASSTELGESDTGSSIDTAVDDDELSLGLSMEDINNINQDDAVIGSVIVRKVFASIARPMIIELRMPLENYDLTDDNGHLVLRPGILVKEGDNLMQDLGVEIMFQCFNHVWALSPIYADKENEVPFSVNYEVFPTSTTQGFMQALTGLKSVKEYDWDSWRNKYGRDKDRVSEMLRSTVGAYVGTYVCGGRDRHFDNVLVMKDKHLLHIDFGFLLGTSPPIDGPRIAIAPQMEAVFKDLKVWDKFVDMFVDAFIALRRVAPTIIRTSVVMFATAGFEEEQIRSFLQGRFSLNVHEKESKAAEFVRKQIVHSSTDIKTKFKSFAHKHIDPAWYGLLEKGFPPALAIMKIVDAKEQKMAKKLATNIMENHAVKDEERIQI